MSGDNQFEMENNAKMNSVYPFSPGDDKASGLVPNKEEIEGLVKHPETFQISQDLLVNIVKEAEKRKFAQEIDKLESLGGSSPFPFFPLMHSQATHS